MYSFCVQEQMALAYHLEGLRVPLVVRVPQVGNHCPSSSADCARELFKGSNGSDSFLDCTRKKIFWLGVVAFL